MATLAPVLRRLFSRLDFAAQAKEPNLARLASYWRQKRAGDLFPALATFSADDLASAASSLFVFKPMPDVRDYQLVMGRAGLSGVADRLGADGRLTSVGDRRLAARLRRLFAYVCDTGEPLVAEFNDHRDGRTIAWEALVAPVLLHDQDETGVLGALAVRGPARATRHRERRVDLRPQLDPAVFALGESKELGESMCHHLGIPLAPLEEREFEDGEHKIRSLTNVRGRTVFVLQNLAGDRHQSANDRLCKLLFFVASLKDSGAARVIAVVPYLSFARKDRQTKARDPVTSRYVAQLFEAVGVDHVVAIEVHNPSAFQNAFRCATDHLNLDRTYAEHFTRLLGQEPLIVVSPDAGGAKRAERFRQMLEAVAGRPVGAGQMSKHRSMDRVTGDLFVGDVADRAVIVVDDMISSGTTMARVASACADRNASQIHVAATHGLFSGGSPRLVEEKRISSIVITDSLLPLRIDPGVFGGRLVTLSVVPLLAESIERINAGGSIVDLIGNPG